MGKLIDKIKRDLKNTTKFEMADYISQWTIIATLIFSWMFLIFEPVLLETEKFGVNSEEPNSLVVVCLLGFILLSLWFTLTWIHYTLHNYIMKLIVRITGWQKISKKNNSSNIEDNDE